MTAAITIELPLDTEAEEIAAGIAIDSIEGAFNMYMHLEGADFYDPAMWAIVEAAIFDSVESDDRDARMRRIAKAAGLRRARLERLRWLPRISTVDSRLHYPRRIKAAAAARRELYRLAGIAAEIGDRQAQAHPTPLDTPPKAFAYRKPPHNHRANYDCVQPGCPDAGYRDPRFPDWHGMPATEQAVA